MSTNTDDTTADELQAALKAAEAEASALREAAARKIREAKAKLKEHKRQQREEAKRRRAEEKRRERAEAKRRVVEKRQRADDEVPDVSYLDVAPAQPVEDPTGGFTSAELAAYLRAVREAKGLGQTHVGRRVGISVSQVSRIEAGQRGLALDRLGVWSRTLGSRAELVLFPDPPQPVSLDVLAQEVSAEELEALVALSARMSTLTPAVRGELSRLLGLWRAAISVEVTETED